VFYWHKKFSFSQKLWAIVATSFVARVIIFFTLPNTPSSLGPDEGTYASLTKWIAESKPANQFPLFGDGLYLSARSIIVPASFLYRAGLVELDAIRLVSTIYGLCGQILVVAMILKLYKKNTIKPPNDKFNEHLIVSLVLVFSLLPSHFVWSNLGLRESATEFWILTSFITFFAIYSNQKRITPYGISVLVISITLTFSARPQAGWVLGVAISAYLIFNLRKPKAAFILSIVLCAVALGSTLNLANNGNSFSPVINAAEGIVEKQEMNQIGAASAITTPDCPRDKSDSVNIPQSKFDTYFCIGWRAPYMVSTFLFRPIIGVDVTSTSSLIAALENLFWAAIFMTLFLLSIRRRTISFVKPLLPSAIFLVLYVLGASAYQGNMGTGFRHKSLILWSVLLLTFALAWRKPKETSEMSRNNSQESAV
jgi:hypothetical protein